MANQKKMSKKPSILKGTRDFLPQTMVKRNYIFSTIKHVFEKYAFSPIETPCIEKTETLMGKYGDEGDRLIFRVLNLGDTLKKADITALAQDNLARFANSVSDKALRYDLTVPFARYVVLHQNEIVIFHLSVIKFNQYGEQTVRKKGDSVNFINVMQM